MRSNYPAWIFVLTYSYGAASQSNPTPSYTLLDFTKDYSHRMYTNLPGYWNGGSGGTWSGLYKKPWVTDDGTCTFTSMSNSDMTFTSTVSGTLEYDSMYYNGFNVNGFDNKTEQVNANTAHTMACYTTSGRTTITIVRFIPN